MRPEIPVAMPQAPPRRNDNARQLRDAAIALEAQFLSEMLEAARFGEPRDSFGGGTSEAQFASFLRDAHARELAERGGIGLAEQIFETMKDRMHD